ncbi:hypothetical protein PN465_21255 [Nodularia spumigena CS-584]|uniref:Uncharacterized protein n=3 Tax=Nodularia spumigena TaxID=70799 RepID=A0A2S0Q6Q9_NODSP|nr:hypothetical protein [Nodularia spumigena]AHJ28098.1 hypothetical protein NSP_17640 [Nodularia spumigena CCY9414]AVZ30129.1 hypothetical protein BMF81_01358 [Nodularia spumigena UHCC 0039]EAW43425.1 hypothetical protein N9414_07184 [Nodularia spumigena CCY9414]KZL51006.1 hypothetical protein A2T98_04515 [Nodularia spumigena CENA596]MDB9384722.1 hypothetical protein [Nodularia spumigena CS-584]
MLNNITKFLTARQWRFPILVLLLTLGVVGEQTKPVWSNQIETASGAMEVDANFAESSNQAPVLSRLRQVREQRNLIQKMAAERQNSQNPQQSPPDSLNTDNSQVQQRSRFVSSAKLLNNINTAPQPTSLFTRPESVRANFPTKDGTYLYGQSPVANQIGQAYVLFENRDGRITGALYMPQSEFSCFQGAIDQSGELAMTVTTSPGEVGTNQLATGNQFQIPSYSDDQMVSYPYSVALQDYHQLNSISTNDQRILEMCKEVYSGAN